MKQTKSILQEYFSAYKIRVWETVWAYREEYITFDEFGKNVQKEVKWFVKNKFLLSKREKGQTLYKANLKNPTVKEIIKCFDKCINNELNKEITKEKLKKQRTQK